MNKEICLKYLADCPEHIDVCAAWIYGRWGFPIEGCTLASTVKMFTDASQKGAIPLAIVAVDNETNVPVACGVLTDKDGEQWSQYTPWAISVYTHYRYRGQGIARSILKRLEEETKRLGHEALYLRSGSAASFYLEIGYEAMEVMDTTLTMAGTFTLLKKVL